MKKIIAWIALPWVVISSSFAQAPLNSLDFDGADDYVSIGLPYVFTNISGNDFTVETWVKPAGNGTQRVFFAQMDANHFVSVLLNATNVPYVYIYATAVSGFNAGSSLPIQQWSHLALTWKASTQETGFFVNGISQSLTAGGASTFGINNVLTLGSRSDGTQNLTGELDEFRIWDYARSACEIGTGMYSEFTEPQPGLVLYYPFNEGTAGGNNSGLTILPDFNGVYNGTLINFALTGPVSNWMSSGAIITSVNQSGSVNTTVTQNGYVLTANAPAATYRWLNCNNNYVFIAGQTGQSFTAPGDGSYAVEVSQNNCVDTSACIVISTIGIPEVLQDEQVRFYPNPSGGRVTVELGKVYLSIHAVILDITGRILYTRDFPASDQIAVELPESAACYFIEITTPEGRLAPLRVIREGR